MNHCSGRAQIWLGMPRAASIGIAAALIIGLLAGCEAVFTYSPVSFMQRNPENLSTDQQKEYYEDVVAGGGEIDDESLASLTALAGETDDPEIDKLAANAFIKASKIDTALTSIVEEIVGGGGIEDVSVVTAFVPEEGETISTETVVAAFTEIGVDVEKFTAGAAFLSEAADSGAELSETDYLIGGAGLALDAVEEVETLDETSKTELKQELEEAGSFEELVTKAEGGELAEEQAALVLQVDQAQEFLSAGISAMESQLSTETTSGEESEGESEGEEGSEEGSGATSLPAGIDMGELLAQLLGASL